jgi:hypothetical protein
VHSNYCSVSKLECDEIRFLSGQQEGHGNIEECRRFE